MGTLATFVAEMEANNQIAILAGNPAAQFGPSTRPLLGATLLPERRVENNLYKESGIRFRTLIANDGTRYSPAQKRSSGQLVGEFMVELGNQDTADELTSNDYDALLALIRRNASIDAMATVIQWLDAAIIQGLVQRIEVQRWQAIVNASVVRLGDNGFKETVAYPNPTGHRAAAGGTWSDVAYDPFDDIYAMADKLSSKGYTVSRIISTRAVTAIMARNPKVQTRAAPILRTVDTTSILGRVGLGNINAALAADGLPEIEVYDNTYQDLDGTKRYLAEGTMVLVAETGVDPAVVGDPEDGDDYIPIEGPLGYTAIGRAVGQATPGRVIHLAAHEDKPPRLEAEGWQTTLPVITHPEAITAITGIS